MLGIETRGGRTNYWFTPFIFLVGAGMHLGLGWQYVATSYSPDQDSSAVWNQWTALTIGVAGGIYSVVAVRRLLHHIGQSEEIIWVGAILRGVGLGALVMTATFVTLFVAFAASMTLNARGVNLFVAYSLSLVSISTMGLAVIFMSLPLALVFGAALGGLAAWFAKTVELRQGDERLPREIAGTALVVGLLALFLNPIPFIGLAMAVTAITVGFRAFREIGHGNWKSKSVASLAIGIGTAGVGHSVWTIIVLLL